MDFDFQDWEVLHPDSTPESVPANSCVSVDNFDEIRPDSDDIIKTNYFSLDSQNLYANPIQGGAVSEECSDTSDNPSWIDPGLENLHPRKESTEFWSDSGSNLSDDRKFGEFEGKNELGPGEDDKKKGIEVIGGENEPNTDKFWSDSGGVGSELTKFKDFEKHSEMGIGENSDLGHRSEAKGEDKQDNEAIEGEGEKGEENVVIQARNVEERKSVVWWKVPLEFLKYCVFRVSPVWTFSMAAAMMGFVILGRRLYKMKRKARSLELKVTMDNKKMSQFMSRAARLNEAFSVVKRVPVIRPPLPAAGVTPWPVMSMR